MTQMPLAPAEVCSVGLESGTHVYNCAGGAVLIEDRDVLLQGFYARDEVDLIITTPDGARHLIKSFYVPQKRPALSDGHATTIPGDLAARFAGPAAIRVHAAGGVVRVPIGQARSVGGTVTATRVDGAVVALAAGQSLYIGDVIETGPGGRIGMVLTDGTTVALGENGELVLNEFMYNQGTHGGREVISLISGVAEFLSGSIAKSGIDHMIFKTPVGTIGVRGTRVFVAFDPDAGNITIINRPTDVDTSLTHAGSIFLSKPDGTDIGQISAANGGWSWNPANGQAPVKIQLTEARVQEAVATVENIVNAIAPSATDEDGPHREAGAA